jgi:hypothetical protein
MKRGNAATRDPNSLGLSGRPYRPHSGSCLPACRQTFVQGGVSRGSRLMPLGQFLTPSLSEKAGEGLRTPCRPPTACELRVSLPIAPSSCGIRRRGALMTPEEKAKFGRALTLIANKYYEFLAVNPQVQTLMSNRRCLSASSTPATSTKFAPQREYCSSQVVPPLVSRTT